MHHQASDSMIRKSKQGVENCLQNIRRLESVIQQMEKLKTRLKTLPDKLSHPTQVPVGIHAPGTPPLLLLNGKLKHTNEIMVLIGDNWFVERTAKQSIDILDRRISKTKKIIDDFQKEKDNYDKWIETVVRMQQDGEQLVDLREDYDEEADKKWRNHHRDKVRAEKMRERSERMRLQSEDDGELMRRMERLELHEEQTGGGHAAAAAASASTAFTGVVNERPAAPLTASTSHPDPVTGRVSKFAAARKHL